MNTVRKNKDYYANNKDACIAKVIAWQGKNQELVKQYKTKSRKNARAMKPYMAAIYDARARSIRKDIEFSLTESWARERWTGKCELTGIDFIFNSGRPNAYSLSLDRIDPSKGYTKENCRFILWSVNRFKSNYDDSTMMHIARLLVEGALKNA